MTTMQAAKWVDTNKMELDEIEVPTLPENWALVEVAFNGICGSDLGILHGGHPRATHGLVPGHEISGRIADPGSTGLEVGTLVAVEPLISCGQCGACRSGNTHVCKNLKLYGIDTPGGLARFAAFPAEVIHLVPESVGAQTAALVEPLAVAVHAIQMSGLQRGDTVAIAGGGPIGILTALVAQDAGAEEIILSEPSPWRREVAKKYGFSVVEPDVSLTDAALAATEGEGVDVFFDTAGHPAVTGDYTSATRVRGTIVVVGVHKKPAAVDLQGVCFKEQTLKGVRVYTSEDFERAIELIADDRLSLANFPVKVYELQDIEEAFEAADKGADCLKVLITPGGNKA